MQTRGQEETCHFKVHANRAGHGKDCIQRTHISKVCGLLVIHTWEVLAFCILSSVGTKQRETLLNDTNKYTQVKTINPNQNVIAFSLNWLWNWTSSRCIIKTYIPLALGTIGYRFSTSSVQRGHQSPNECTKWKSNTLSHNIISQAYPR